MAIARSTGIKLLELDPFMPQDTQISIPVNSNVRRFLHGLSRKKDIHAYISVWRRARGEQTVPLSLYDSSAPGGASNVNHNFLIQSLSVQHQERSQIIETFGVPYIFFYGRQAQVIQVQGALVNTLDFNWKNEWLANYDQYLRGTRCVENQARVMLGIEESIIEGYILATQYSQTAQETPYFIPFSFTMFVTHNTLVGAVSSGDVTSSADGRDSWAVVGVKPPNLGTQSARKTASGIYVEYIGGAPVAEQQLQIVDPISGKVTTGSALEPASRTGWGALSGWDAAVSETDAATDVGSDNVAAAISSPAGASAGVAAIVRA